MIYVFDSAGRCLERNNVRPEPPLDAFRANHGSEALIHELETDPYPDTPLAYLTGLVGDGCVTGMAVDPAWQPPASPQPSIDDTAQRLASLEAAVAQNILASPHDRRWAAQKETAKEVMAWIKRNPQCTQTQVEEQIAQALAQAFPGQPVVLSPGGLIASYTDEAARRGYLEAAGFEELRGLVVASSDEQLRAMLSVL